MIAEHLFCVNLAKLSLLKAIFDLGLTNEPFLFSIMLCLGLRLLAMRQIPVLILVYLLCFMQVCVVLQVR